MAQPLLALLKRIQPEQTIDVLAPSWVAPLFTAMREVRQVIPTNLKHGKWNLRARWQIARSLRAQHYACAYVLPNSWKSALIPWFAGIPKRVGYIGEARYGLLTHYFAQPEQTLAMVQRYARLAQHLPVSSCGKDGTRKGKAANDPFIEVPQPQLEIPSQILKTVQEKFALDLSLPLIALCPGAEFGPAKRWPAEHFAQLANLLHAQSPKAHILILGGPGDRVIAQEICAATYAPVQMLAGQTTLIEAIALIACAQAVVSNDSGLMHVAAALRRRQVALFGSSDPRHTPPLSPHAQIVWLHLECSPCFARTCPLGHLRCLKEITPEKVAHLLQTGCAYD